MDQWIELTDPQTGRMCYANPQTGDCSWDRPPNVQLRPQNPAGAWWELYSVKHKLSYYYHSKTTETVWSRPAGEEIISLGTISHAPFYRIVALQRSMNTPSPSVSRTSSRRSSAVVLNQGSKPSIAAEDVPPDVPPPVADAPPPPTIAINPQLRPKANVSDKNRVSITPSLPNSLQMEIQQFKIEGFAKRYFSTHKRGIFRKKVPVERMLCWSKDSLNQPLLVLNKSLHQLALTSFKLIQKIMLDRATKAKSVNDDIQALLDIAVNRGEVRDEIYCQICKQVKENPRPESTRRGWELVSVCVITFPPSKNFEDYLKSFISDHARDVDPKIATFAQYCQRKLLQICLRGPRGKVPTIAEIDRGREASFCPSVFGETLSDIMAMQKNEFPALKLPRILNFLAEGVLQLNGCKTEGSDSNLVSCRQEYFGCRVTMTQ